MLYGVTLKPKAYMKMRPACLTAFIALNGFAVALVLFLAYFIGKDGWDISLPKCPKCHTTPSFLQIQVLGGSENSTLEVVVDPEREPMAR